MADMVDPFEAPLPARGKAATPESAKAEQVAPVFEPEKPVKPARERKVKATKPKVARAGKMPEPAPEPVVAPEPMPEPDPDMAADESPDDTQDTAPPTEPTPAPAPDAPQPGPKSRAKRKRQPDAPAGNTEASQQVNQREAQRETKQEQKADDGDGMKDMLEALKETRGLMTAILTENIQIKQQLSDIINNGLTIKWQ